MLVPLGIFLPTQYGVLLCTVCTLVLRGGRIELPTFAGLDPRGEDAHNVC